jgi:glycosyltransferase involved in cell wall biosynthesis
MTTSNNHLSYLITVSQNHLLSAQFLIVNLRKKTNAQIVVVGNLKNKEIKLINSLGAKYIDENQIDFSGRLPQVSWEKKYREFGWYKQQFIRLCIDQFMTSEQVVILDAEVFPFENWDETRFYDPRTGNPRSFYWTPKVRKSDWDYKMYRGAAYLLNFLPECKGIMEYANSNNYKRHISGVVLFSTRNVRELWRRLQIDTDVEKNINLLFNHEVDLAFSDHDIYGLAVEYGLFDRTVPTVMHNNLLGWYDNHDDPNFHVFKTNSMWSMCQRYFQYNDADSYSNFMKNQAQNLNQMLPKVEYWNQADIELINDKSTDQGIRYFEKYKNQLDYTFRSRFSSMYKSMEFLHSLGTSDVNIVEIGTLRDNNKGGGHSTYKFGEYCSKFGGTLHTVDILSEAIDYSMRASAKYQPWIKYYIQDSEEFLHNFAAKIDFLYLDGYDSTPGNETQASQKQLNEIKIALPKLNKKCVVLLDDADLPEGGKAKLSSQFLIDNGFELVVDNYQQLYARGFKKLNPDLPKSNLQTSVNLERLIDDLPEVYQSIYLHGELIREGVRGNEFERLEVIKNYIKPGQTILDVGSNVGFFTINLAKLFPDNVFVSVENQYSYARLQRELIELEGVTNVILINSTMSTEWLIKAAQACTYFDTTLLLSILHHIPDAENFLTQLGQVSKSFIIELPHPDESKVCGKDIIRKQLTVEKISQVKPAFIKMPYESTTHCDANLKRSFYYADSPDYQRDSIYPYIGYPLAPRSYNLQVTDRGLIIQKNYLAREIKAIPGVLFGDIAQIGAVLAPSYETCIKQTNNELDRLEQLDNVADLRPWNMLFTANGLQFIDHEYTPDLDQHLKFNKFGDFNLIKNYLGSIFNIQFPPTIIVDGVFFQLYNTGIARVWQSLLQEWVASGFAKHIILLDRVGTAPRIQGIRYRTIPAYDYGNTDRDRAMLQQICDEESADVFISSYYTTPIDTPSIFMAHDMIPELMGWNLNEPMWQEKHYGIQNAAAYISVSENTEKDLLKCFPTITPELLTVAHNGVNHQIFVPATQDNLNTFKTKYGITKPYFILVGAGGGYKNSPLFFQAFNRLATSRGFDIVCTGSSNLLSADLRACTAGSTVHMLQLSDEELALAYSGAAALVYPSKYEGFGMPIVEAMACGCPVITCPNASIPEVAGDAAIYVNDDDIDSMAAALCEVQKPQIRAALISKGLTQAQQFSWTKMGDIVKAVLLEQTLTYLQLSKDNLIIFPDWTQDEEELGEEISRVCYNLAQSSEYVGQRSAFGTRPTLLIDTTNAEDIESVNMLISGIAMNLMMGADIDITEHLEIALTGELATIQWQALLPKLHGKIKLGLEDVRSIESSGANLISEIPLIEATYRMPTIEIVAHVAKSAYAD